jgi:ABC-type transport system substrate-binding protein
VVSYTQPGPVGKLIVERAPGYKYWDPKMWRVKRFEINCGVTDTNTAASGLTTGAFDFISGNIFNKAGLKAALLGTKNKAVPFAGENIQFMALYPKGPFADVKVRTALFQALDLATLTNAGGLPGSACITPDTGQLLYPFDAGYVKTGFKSPLDFNKTAAEAVLRPLNLNFQLDYRSGRADAQAEAEFVQSSLKAVGVTVTLRAQGAGPLGSAYAAGTLQAMLYAATASADAVSPINNMFGTARGGAGPAFDADVKPKLDAVNALPLGSSARAKAITELQAYLLSQAWVKTFCVNKFDNAASPKLHKLEDMPLQFTIQNYMRPVYVLKSS